MRTHWQYWDIPMAKPTKLRLKKNSKLVMAEDTTILNGCYVGIWANKKLEVGAKTYIAHGVTINTCCGMTIGENVLIGHESTLMDYDGHQIYSCKDDPLGERARQAQILGGNASQITIENNVWIGFKVTILKGVTVGSGSIIAANACVTADVPRNSIVAGNPARVVKKDIAWLR